jgi:hypothetical protein
MSKFAQISAVILIFGVFFVFPASAQVETEWTKAVLQNMYMEYLREEGYLPSVDEDGDILFKVSGSNYFIIVDENPQYFRIYTGVSLGSFLPEDALSAANYINMHSRVAKVYISSDGRSVAFNTELLLSDPRNFKPVLARALSLMRFAENNFFKELEESTP